MSTHSTLSVSFALIVSIVVLTTAEASGPCGPEISIPLRRAMFDMGIAATPDGLLVHTVNVDGQAAKAGLRQGDLIIEIDGHAAHFADNIDALRWGNGIQAGRPIKMLVVRNGSKFTATAVGRAPTCEEARRLSERLAGEPPSSFATTCRHADRIQ